ncbi:unnamed protein product [Peronospora belbahrii]|uniref:Telomere-associated protein Rif1 N-terminal domain-containing protein n=1 Tax=Peronospora belbahrii TaxID=622444 RepID=A0AAU9L8L1_9STRA|nr:unnamed protein product [Peronospora belbahrii]
MEAAETQLARALTALTEHEFPLSRGMEKRMDAYLQLEDFQHLEDSEASVIQLQKHLPSLLGELRFDLEHKTLSEVLHASMQCLSYFMNHRSLASSFSDDDLAFFLGELIKLLFSTTDRNTFKLCLWCLTVSNIPVERHKYLPHTVEGLVHAVVNPFKSRAIEIQALKGLHLLLVKYPEQLCANRTVLSIYVRPIASRLSSSDASARTQARLVLEEASKYIAKWSHETLQMVQDCTEQYVLPAMKLHMDRGRQKDAVYLWKLTLVLLKSRFLTDLEKLNQVLYVPEKCMKDQDAAVRLMTMHAWAGIVDIFHDCQDWLFNKAVVILLAWPVKACLEQERLLNVVNAAFLSWKKIVSVAVQDFNMYCKVQQQDIEAGQQQIIPEWKFWFGELVMSPQLTLMRTRICNNDSSSIEMELEHFVNFSERIWEPVLCESGKSASDASRSESSIMLDGLGVNESVATKQHQNGSGLILTGVQTCDAIGITSDLLGIAFLLADIFTAIPDLIKIFNESHGKLSKRCAHDLAMATWNGVCQRVLSGMKRNDTMQVSKFALRLVRMLIEFLFGILTWTPVSAVMPVSPSVTAFTEQSGEHNDGKAVVTTSVEFGLEWQLQLLAPLVSGVAFIGDLECVILHSKCKLFDHITQRMNCLTTRHAQCAIVLEKWNKIEDRELRIDFTAKSNVLSYLVLNLLCEYAVFVDDMTSDCESKMELTLASLEIVLRRLALSLKLQSRQDSRVLSVVICCGETFIRVAHELIASGNVASETTPRSERTGMLDKLVSICNDLTEHSNESQQNVSLSLNLQESCEHFGAGATVSTTSISSDASDGEEKSTGVAAPEAANVSVSFDSSISSPFLLSEEKLAIQSPIERSSSSSLNEQPKLQRPSQQGPYTSFDKSYDAKRALTAGDAEQKDAPSSSTKVSPIRSVGSQLVPLKLVSERDCRSNFSTLQCIYPDLVGSTEEIASLFRHLPLGFRPIFSFYKIRTIGDLSALPVEKVKTFGVKNPVSTVRRALEEFNGRKSRMQSLAGSCLATTSPAISTPSPHKPTKRSFPVDCGMISPIILETREHKRAKRSLVLDAEDGDHKQENGGACRKCEQANKVTLCLPFDEADETRISRVGKDLDNQIKLCEKIDENDNRQEKMDSYTVKLLQHLRRSAYYIDKLVAEAESMHSGEASLQTKITTTHGVITNYHEAHDLVVRLASQLQIVAETSSKRCHKLLEKFVST